MTNPIQRRTVLLGLGQTAAFGSLAAALPRLAAAAQAQAAAPAPQKVVLTMLYPSGEGLSFDADAFRDRHVALLKRAYGPAIERIELRVAPPVPASPPPPPVAEGEEPPPPPPAPPVPPLLAAVSVWLGSISEFIQRAQASSREIATDMATITKSAPMVQYDVIEGQAGVAPGSVIGGTMVVSSYFFAKEGGTWDAQYFGKTYAPKVVESYGAEAIQRAEVARGELAQGGGTPLVAGAVHMYLKDGAAFDAALATEAVSALGAEAQQHTTLNPVTILMTVHATG